MIVGHIGGAGAPYEIQKSLRFRASALAYLSRIPTVTGNRKTWTWSGWVKRGALGAGPFTLFSATNGPSADAFDFTNDELRFTYYTGTTTVLRQSTGVFRDTSAWYHLMWVLDTSNATAQDRLRAYVNGIEITTWSTNVAVPLNQQLALNNNVAHTLGSNLVGNQGADGYLSEVNFIDGQALTPSSFGEFSAETGAWISKKYAGTYGTNGFYLPFNDGSNLTNLTADRSGNGNNWTANNISLTSGVTYDWMDDTPTNNYAVLSPLDKGSGATLSDGNLLSSTSVSENFGSNATIGISSGKFYWEISSGSGLGVSMFGIRNASASKTIYVGGDVNGYAYYQNGNKYTNNVGVAYGASWTTNDVIGVAFNCDDGSIIFYKNNTSQGAAFTGIPANTWFPAISDGSSILASADHINFGQRPFAYSPPAGFKALCTKNLSGVTITTSGTFTGNAAADGPFIWLNGVPTAMTINGNTVTFGTHADKTAGGFKVRSSSASYNAAGSNTYSITSTGAKFNAPANAQGNP